MTIYLMARAKVPATLGLIVNSVLMFLTFMITLVLGYSKTGTYSRRRFLTTKSQ